ncbi:MAG: hypothetical protein AABX25_00875 [Nanoarchaeota archaeon]
MHTSIDAAIKPASTPEIRHNQTLFNRLGHISKADLDVFEERFGLQGLIELRHVMVDLLTDPLYAIPQTPNPPQETGTIGSTPSSLYPSVGLNDPRLGYADYEKAIRSLFWELNRYLYPILTKQITRH